MPICSESGVQMRFCSEVNVDFMKEAVEEAVQGVAAGDGGPFGAVVVKDGKIVARGHNMVLSSNDPTAHAEVTVIRKAAAALNSFDLSGCQLYTSCYPCPMCMGASLWARLDAIYYGATAKQAAEVGFDDHAFHEFLKDPKSDDLRKLEKVDFENVLKPFNIWADKQDKTAY